MAIDAVKRVRTVVDGRVEVDVKRYARVEKIPGGELDDCKVRRGLDRLLDLAADWSRYCAFWKPLCGALPRRTVLVLSYNDAIYVDCCTFIYLFSFRFPSLANLYGVRFIYS